MGYNMIEVTTMGKQVKEPKVKPKHDLRITEATPEALAQAVVKVKPEPRKEPKWPWKLATERVAVRVGFQASNVR